MLRYASATVDWLINIFNPPPLASMTRTQKLNRSLLITLALVVNCVLLAMLVALGVYLLERGRQILSTAADEVNALAIIFVSIGVNMLCVIVLFQIKKADQKLLEKPPETPPEP